MRLLDVPDDFVVNLRAQPVFLSLLCGSHMLCLLLCQRVPALRRQRVVAGLLRESIPRAIRSEERRVGKECRL